VDNEEVEGERAVELARRRPARPLAGMVAGIVGLAERFPGPVTRRQPAGTLVPLVISFGSPLTVQRLSDGEGAHRSYRSFVAGLSTGHATTRHPGDQDCVQVYLTPLGVRRVLAVDDVAPELGEPLAERLAAAASWSDRFDLVEAALTRRVTTSRPTPDWIRWTWHRLSSTGGRASIGELVETTGWSHRHVTTRFRDEVGLTPTEAAGVLRFERAASALRAVPLAELAARCGYADQSHMTRDFVRHAGEPPAALAAARRPTPRTALGLGG